MYSLAHRGLGWDHQTYFMYVTEQLSDGNIRLFLAHSDSSSCFPDASGPLFLGYSCSIFSHLVCIKHTGLYSSKQKREKKHQESRSNDLLPGDTNSLVRTDSLGVKEVTEVRRIVVQRHEKDYRGKQIIRLWIMRQTGLQLYKHPKTKMLLHQNSHWMKGKHDIGGFAGVLPLN